MVLGLPAFVGGAETCGPLRVVVLDSFGKPIPRVEIEVTGRFGRLSSGLSPYLIEHVSCGDMQVSAWATGFRASRQTIRTSPTAQVIVLALSLTPIGDPASAPIAVQGRVTNGKVDVDLVKLVALFGEWSFWAALGPDGRFSFPVVPGGTYQLFVFREGRTLHRRQVEVHSRIAPITIELAR